MGGGPLPPVFYNPVLQSEDQDYFPFLSSQQDQFVFQQPPGLASSITYSNTISCQCQPGRRFGIAIDASLLSRNIAPSNFFAAIQCFSGTLTFLRKGQNLAQIPVGVVDGGTEYTFNSDGGPYNYGDPGLITVPPATLIFPGLLPFPAYSGTSAVPSNTVNPWVQFSYITPNASPSLYAGGDVVYTMQPSFTLGFNFDQVNFSYTAAGAVIDGDTYQFGIWGFSLCCFGL